MLVITREIGQEIVIIGPDGTRIDLRLVDTRGRKSRIGFESPRSVEIWRREIFDAKQRENRAAAQEGAGK
jgi:carbon storage regulator CsrA